MARNVNFDMGFPPFRGATRQIIVASGAIYVVTLLLLSFAQPTGQGLISYGALTPAGISHGWWWQFVTYAFIYVDPIDFLLSLLGVYFLGWAVEERIGPGRFYGLFFGSTILSGVAGFGLSVLGPHLHSVTFAQGAAAGCGAAVNAILMVFYLFNRSAPIMLFPIPIQIPVKWMVIGIGGIETAYLLLHGFALYDFVLLLGLGAGYVWYSLFLTRRSSIGISEKYFSLRNSYYRWKRRRAARKFEVYMRDHDRTVTFDEHGNYIPPEDANKKNGGSKSGWVN
ncbi:MAG TPA: rhomboid family intramembrane serine protease [Terriglobales bacterium]|nr:rhomboid family intramembrane serine protease [Terriglobales bacterium]